MNIVFLGSSKFAVASLRRIVSSRHKVVCAVTQPDSLKGRGLVLSSTEVKQFAEEYRLKIYQPDNINHRQSVDFLKELDADVFVVAAFGQILQEALLSVPRIMAVNLHASLLPKYRGAAPINWALIRGETQTGVSIIKVIPKLDAGPIILQKRIHIDDNEQAETLAEKLSVLGGDGLVESLDLIETGGYNLDVQKESEVSFAPKMKKEDGLICWDKPAAEIFNLIRGCAGWPGAFTYCQDKILKIHKAVLVKKSDFRDDHDILPGRVIEASKEGILIGTGEGIISIEELQVEGRKRVTAESFIAGYKVLAGQIFGRKK